MVVSGREKMGLRRSTYPVDSAYKIIGRTKSQGNYPMMREHLHRHGLTFGEHFRNNWSLTIMALKSAFYTLGHGFSPRVSGMRASQLHNEIWVEGRKASINDLRHRLENELYANKEDAVAEYLTYAALYNEEPLMTDFAEKIEEHFSHQ